MLGILTLLQVVKYHLNQWLHSVLKENSKVHIHSIILQANPKVLYDRPSLFQSKDEDFGLSDSEKTKKTTESTDSIVTSLTKEKTKVSF